MKPYVCPLPLSLSPLSPQREAQPIHLQSYIFTTYIVAIDRVLLRASLGSIMSYHA